MPINRAFQRLKKPRKDGFLEKLKIERIKIMKARFLHDVLIDDGKYSMTIDKGEIIDAIDELIMSYEKKMDGELKHQKMQLEQYTKLYR